MKIAVPVLADQILPDFENTSRFKIYDVAAGQVFSTVVEEIFGYGHGVLVAFLQDLCISAVLCDSVPREVKSALTIAGIAVYDHFQGSADSAVEALLAGKLQPNQ